MKPKIEAEIEQLLSEGERWSVIAKTLHVSNRTISKVATRMSEPSFPPPPAKQVFTDFEAGKSPIDIVKETNADPATIGEWFEEWLRMKKNWRLWQEFKKAEEYEKDGKETKKDGKAEKRDWKGFLKEK